MRPGSEIREMFPPWFSSGTFRSERTRTPRPETPSASRSERVVTEDSASALERLADQCDQVDETVRVAPLVVVPGHGLGLVADDLGQARVEQRAVRIGDDVARSDRCVVVLQDALERTFGGRLERRVDLIGGRRLL